VSFEQKHQISNQMEVHTHTHTARKKWTHYFWEFLMLFLAVFCGFLAEYQLEHKIERDREKQFIRSLVQDLSEDMATLRSTATEQQANVQRMDSLIDLLCRDNVRGYERELYYLGRRASRGGTLALHDRTIQQMKNSGGFRLIRKETVSKAIIEYYNRLDFITMLKSIELNETDEYRKQAINIFHPSIVDNLVTPDNQVIRPEGNPDLLTYEKNILIRLAGMVSYTKNTRLAMAKAELEMEAAAKSLIELLKKEYRLK
jgi:hypothetical protein